MKIGTWPTNMLDRTKPLDVFAIMIGETVLVMSDLSSFPGSTHTFSDSSHIIVEVLECQQMSIRVSMTNLCSSDLARQLAM